MARKDNAHKVEAEVLREIRREAADRGDWREVEEVDQEIVDLYPTRHDG